MTFIERFILVFLSAIVTDIVWGIYIKAVGDSKAARAALFSSLIMVFGIFNIISYMDDHRLILAAIAGAFVGTYITVKFHKKKA